MRVGASLDSVVPANLTPRRDFPPGDVSLNYVPVPHRLFMPAVIQHVLRGRTKTIHEAL